MPVHMGISWDRERKGEERDRDERRGGKKTRWKQREGVRKKRKASGKEQERAQGGAFIFIFLKSNDVEHICTCIFWPFVYLHW